jgi:hypothetical protein
MGLEAGTFVNDLVSANPVGTEPKSQGDDHLRLIKTVLRNTLIGATRAFHFPAAPAAKSGAYTILLTDQNSFIRGDVTGGGFTMTLPQGALIFDGYEVTVAKSDSSSNNLTVDGNGSETINGAANRVLDAQFVSETYRWEGSEWKIVATYTEVAQSTVGDGLEIDSGALRVKLDGVSIARGTDGVKRQSTHVQKTAAYTAVAADNGTLVEMNKSTAVTLALTAAATLGDGWFLDINNSGAGTLTLDPDGAELIDGESTITLLTDESLRIVCTGTAFLTAGRTPFSREGEAKAWVKFTPPSGTGACTLNASFNVTGVNRDSLGQYTITWDTNFSSGDYAVNANGLHSSVMRPVTIRTQAAGTVVLVCHNDTGVLNDVDSMSVVAFGAQ